MTQEKNTHLYLQHLSLLKMILPLLTQQITFSELIPLKSQLLALGYLKDFKNFVMKEAESILPFVLQQFSSLVMAVLDILFKVEFWFAIFLLSLHRLIYFRQCEKREHRILHRRAQFKKVLVTKDPFLSFKYEIQVEFLYRYFINSPFVWFIAEFLQSLDQFNHCQALGS